MLTALRKINIFGHVINALMFTNRSICLISLGPAEVLLGGCVTWRCCHLIGKHERSTDTWGAVHDSSHSEITAWELQSTAEELQL